MTPEEQQGVQKLVADAVAAAVTKIEGVVAGITQRLEAVDGKIAEAVKNAGALGEEAVKKIAAEIVGTELSSREQAAKDAADKTAADKAIADARNAFITANAAKIPEAYRGLIPNTSNADELKTGLQKALDAMKTDFTALGMEMPSLGAPAGGEQQEQKPASKSEAELAKMTRQQRADYMQQTAAAAVAAQ